MFMGVEAILLTYVISCPGIFDYFADTESQGQLFD